jgi:DNA replication protein DnaC
MLLQMSVIQINHFGKRLKRTVASEVLFDVVSQRYKPGTTLVTSNLPFDEWTGVFGSERVTGALLDHFTHPVHIQKRTTKASGSPPARSRKDDELTH